MLPSTHILKRQARGFTLIELLVVILIISVLSGIALPTLLNQVNKAKESEAKQALGTCHRLQEAYYAENAAFAETIENLEIGMPYETSNYKYSIQVFDDVYSINPFACCMAEAKTPGLETYLQCNMK